MCVDLRAAGVCDQRIIAGDELIECFLCEEELEHVFDRVLCVGVEVTFG